MNRLKLLSRILLQILLFMASHSLLLLATLSPILMFGIILMSIITAIATFYLWKNASRNVLERTLILMLIAEFLILFGGESEGFYSKARIYYSNINNYLLSSIMIMVVIYLWATSIKSSKEINSKTSSQV